MDEATSFSGLAGNIFSAAMSGPVLGEPVRISARVSGIDGARMDVAAAETTRARRPDLSVTGVTAAPTQLRAGRSASPR